MAAKRGKSQARRNGGNNGGGLPGWAWGVLGLVLGVGLILAAPRFLRSDGDGFFVPQPNPDAQPAPVAGEDDGVVVPDRDAAPRGADKPAKDAAKPTDYDFYTLLPGKEVPMTEAELAATERAEAQRAEQQQKAQATAPATGDTGDTPAAAPATTGATLPKPVDEAAPARATTTAAASASTAATAATGSGTTPATTAAAKPATPVATANSASAGDGSRYLLQAGAFEASGQAEELKARIAMLGLGARVESAAIKGKTVYRVRMGPYGTAGELAEAKRKLAGGGLSGMPIRVQ